MRKRRLSRFIKEIELSGDDIVLDLGGGKGILSEMLSKDVRKVIVLDISRKKLESARRRELEVILGDISNMPVKDNIIDKAFCINVLHHIEDLRSTIREIKRVLKSGGIVFVLDFYGDSLLGKIINLYERALSNPGLIDLFHLEKLFKEEGFEGKIKMVSNFQYVYLGKKS